MVADDRYCIDVVTQISAVRAALQAAGRGNPARSRGHCVEHAIASGNSGRSSVGRSKELMNVVGRAER